MHGQSSSAAFCSTMLAYRIGPHPPVRLPRQSCPQIQTGNCAALCSVFVFPPLILTAEAVESAENPQPCPICKLGRLLVIEFTRVEPITIPDTS